MTRRQDYVIAWIEVKGQRFEILVRPEEAFKYREGGRVSLDDVLWSDTVYRDSRRALKASPEALRKAFGTDDVRVIADRILREGSIQLTGEQRRRMLEAKKRQIIQYIARNAIDPTTRLPIPETRIEAAMEELRIGVDLYRDAESQAVEVVRRLARVMPIRLARALIQARIPPRHSGRVYSEARRLGEVKRAEWAPDGSLILELEVPAGAQVEVVNRLQGMTRGEAQVEVKVVM